MTKPNRVLAHLPKNPSEYWTFSKLSKAAKFAEFARAEGYKVRESKFRIGPRNQFRHQYRVSVYWAADQSPPDKAIFNAKAYAIAYEDLD